MLPIPRPLLNSLSALFLAGAIALPTLKAAEPATPPKPQNVLTPDQALARLVRANQRFISNGMKLRDFGKNRSVLLSAQNPYASILGCADSRVAPEYAFDSGLGNLFVVRVAGNFVSKEGLASLEYGSLVLESPLIVVLGHEHCGAVASTIRAVTENAKFPGDIPSLVSAIKPAVKTSMHEPGNLLDNSIRENVLLNVKRLQTASPILREEIRAGRLKVVGAIYHLEDGRVEFL